MPPRASAERGSQIVRLYQLPLSKQRIKLRRYSASGTTQRNGTEARFCVRWFVIANRKVDVDARSANQRDCCFQVGRLPALATCRMHSFPALETNAMNVHS